MEKERKFRILIPKPVERDFKRLQTEDFKQICNKLERLADDPFPGLRKGIKKLNVKELTYSLRVGRYRILYRVHGSDVVLVGVVSREDLEKELRKLR